MQAQGLLKAIPPEAPEIELDEEFWRNARIVSSEAPGKTLANCASTRRRSRSSVPPAT